MLAVGLPSHLPKAYQRTCWVCDQADTCEAAGVVGWNDNLPAKASGHRCGSVQIRHGHIGSPVGGNAVLNLLAGELIQRGEGRVAVRERAEVALARTSILDCPSEKAAVEQLGRPLVDGGEIDPA